MLPPDDPDAPDPSPDLEYHITVRDLHSLSLTVRCGPLNARLTERGCQLNQDVARRLVARILDRGPAAAIGRESGKGGWRLTRLVACSQCPRCEDRDEWAGMVEWCRQHVTGEWGKWGRLELEYTDDEVKEMRRRERGKRRWRREKERRANR